jgi:hypothetical protein
MRDNKPMKQKDLKLMYREMRHYFCPEMPKDIPIIITRANTYFGTAWQDRNTPSDMGIYFGKPLLLWGMKEYPGVVTWESILLHEMCHIWQYIKIPRDRQMHSPRFMDKLRAVENLTGIPQFWDFVE